MAKESLKQRYVKAAQAAHEEGVRASNEAAVLDWIRRSVRYRPDTEFFMFLGVGSALADIEAQEAGYEGQAHRAYESASRKVGKNPRQKRRRS